MLVDKQAGKKQSVGLHGYFKDKCDDEADVAALLLLLPLLIQLLRWVVRHYRSQRYCSGSLYFSVMASSCTTNTTIAGTGTSINIDTSKSNIAITVRATNSVGVAAISVHQFPGRC